MPGEDPAVTIELSFQSTSTNNGIQQMNFSLRGAIEQDFEICVDERWGCDPSQDMTGPMLICLFHAMCFATKLSVRGGPVSQWLLDRIEDYQRYFVRSRQRSIAINPGQIPMNVVDIDADTTIFKPFQDTCGPLIANYSGGVDSTYGLLALSQSPKTTMRAGTALFVSGYGAESNRATWEHIRTGPEALGFNSAMVHVGLTYPPGVPNASIGARLTGVMRLVGQSLGGCIVFNDHSADEIARITAWNATTYGAMRSSWLTGYAWAWPNSMLSTPEFAVHQHGYQASRVEKCRALKQFSWIEDNLRVCWKGNNGINCCRCEKCIRTATYFMASGTEPPRCLGIPGIEQIDSLWPPSDNLLRHFIYLEAISKHRKAPTEWVDLIARIPTRARESGLKFAPGKAHDRRNRKR